MDKKPLRQNCILSLIAAVLLWGIVAVAFDFFYDLNDDVLIKDIISGVYTGTPEAHNNQMLYPISLILCLFYRILPTIPWFGLMEIGLFIVSFVIILSKLLGLFEKNWHKYVFTCIFTLMFASIYLWEIVMMQYTVVAGMLCAAATILVYTHKSAAAIEKTGEYLKSLWPVPVLLFIAYNIRSEMFLLMCPFMAAAGLARWAKEADYTEENKDKYKGILDASNIRKYFSLIGIILSVLVISSAFDTLAYSNAEWKEFRRFFDARTEVYDFTGIPDYKANEDFYKSQGIEPEQYELLINYNFALDSDIDAEKLEAIAKYARSGMAINSDGSEYRRASKTLRTAVGEYVRNVSRIDIIRDYDVNFPFAEETNQFSPYGVIILLMYVAVFVAAFYQKKGSAYFAIIVMALFRSIAWIYVFKMGRIVPRITHPMYLIELVVLIAVLLDEFLPAINQIKKDGRTGSSGPEVTVTFICITAVCVSIVCGACIGSRWTEVATKSNLREELNEQVCKLDSTLAQMDKYYYLDVYSTVDWTEKVFTRPLSKKNQQLAGGWMAFSPLDMIKKSSYADDFYFVTLQKEDELDWLANWNYMKTGSDELVVEQEDSIEGKKGSLKIFNIDQVVID